MPVIIYALVDPSDSEVRYVGKTVNNPVIRLRDHIFEARVERDTTPKCQWIRTLLCQSLRPLLLILEAVPDDSNWQEREKFWIAKYRSISTHLTNVSDGGECGPRGLKRSQAQLDATALRREFRKAIKDWKLGKFKPKPESVRQIKPCKQFVVDKPIVHRDNKLMKKLEAKKPRALNPAPLVKKKPSKPRKTGLSKSDPDYYRKIGLISAKRRKMTSEDFAAMARASHPRKEYFGGRPKKEVDE